MNTKQLVALAIAFVIVVPSAGAAYDEIECSTDSVFSANSCAQCFDGGQKAEGDTVGFLDDLWINDSGSSKVMYKEEQSMPKMVSLGGTSWSQTPSSDGFWEYTDELDSLYSEADQGYILEDGSSVKFIASALGSAYQLDSSDVAQGENSGLLIFPLTSHTMMEDGDISTDDTAHNECVLFKGGESTPVVTDQPTPEKMTKVETGAEAYLILLFALILGFVFMKAKKVA